MQLIYYSSATEGKYIIHIGAILCANRIPIRTHKSCIKLFNDSRIDVLLMLFFIITHLT